MKLIVSSIIRNKLKFFDSKFNQIGGSRDKWSRELATFGKNFIIRELSLFI